MEEIILSARTDDALNIVQVSNDVAVPLPELRDQLHRGIAECRKVRDRIALTAKARSRRGEEFELAIKALAKSTATEIARPIEDRRCRMEARTRIYTAMTVFAEAAARDREIALRRGRAMTRRGIILTIVTILALGIGAASSGWITLAGAAEGHGTKYRGGGFTGTAYRVRSITNCSGRCQGLDNIRRLGSW